jgi:hypothetical protein
MQIASDALRIADGEAELSVVGPFVRLPVRVLQECYRGVARHLRVTKRKHEGKKGAEE